MPNPGLMVSSLQLFNVEILFFVRTQTLLILESKAKKDNIRLEITKVKLFKPCSKTNAKEFLGG